MTDAAGKLQEKVVTILERHMDPSASVRYGVLLPVVDDPEIKPRPIDVLITTGSKKRPTITIVEVQDRDSKPGRGEFDGWLEKKREVGAQHLMCVTRAGYTDSQLRKAAKLGPAVRLFTLAQLETARSNRLER